MVLIPTSAAALMRDSAAQAANGSIYQGLHFTETGVIFGAVLLLATLFMLWVLWSFWCESRGRHSGSPHKVNSAPVGHSRPNPPVKPLPEPRPAPPHRPSPQPAPQIPE